MKRPQPYRTVRRTDMTIKFAFLFRLFRKDKDMEAKTGRT